MLALKSTVAAFILPPGAFITLLIISGSWFFIRKKKGAAAYQLGIAVLIWLLSIFPVSNTMLRFLESEFDPPQNQVGDVIVLLSESIHPNIVGFLGQGTPSEIMLSRIFAAATLQRLKNLPVIISGSHDQNPNMDGLQNLNSSVAKRYLIELGVPAEKILLEDRSINTLQNAKYSREICLKHDFKNPIVVTSAYHLKRSVLSFKKAGFHALPFPAHFLSWDNPRYVWESVLPGYGNLRNSSIAAKEYLGLIFYHLFY